jgi:hypothetical protein
MESQNYPVAEGFTFNYPVAEGSTFNLVRVATAGDTPISYSWTGPSGQDVSAAHTNGNVSATVSASGGYLIYAVINHAVVIDKHSLKNSMGGARILKGYAPPHTHITLLSLLIATEYWLTCVGNGVYIYCVTEGVSVLATP